MRDDIPAKEYEATCEKLIAQYKTLSEAVKDQIPDMVQFMAVYNMECPAAVNRLVRSGMPATIAHGKPRAHSSADSAKSVADTVQNYITAMDSLKLNMVAIDQIYPILSDLMQSMHKVTQLPPEFEGKVKVKEWISRLHKMPASHDLSDDDVRQLLFDLESSYTTFMGLLG